MAKKNFSDSHPCRAFDTDKWQNCPLRHNWGCMADKTKDRICLWK